jgi:hypothetical protein
MSPLWRPLAGSDPSPSRPRRARRPGTALRPEVSALEGRQLMAITMGTTITGGTTLLNGTTLTQNLVLPPVKATPQFLFPSDGRYVPITVSGGLSSGYVMNFDGAYAVFPKPAYTAHLLGQIPLPSPTDTTASPVTPSPENPPPVLSYTATLPGSKTPVIIPYSLDAFAPPSITVIPPATPGGQAVPLLSPAAAKYTVTLPGSKYSMNVTAVWVGSLEAVNGTFVKVNGQYVISPNGLYQISVSTLPISPFETSVIDARFAARRGPSHAVLQVTDQYRQDEPSADTPLTLLVAPTIGPSGLPVYVKYTYREQVTVPNGAAILRQFSYSFSTHLQARKHAGTSGRQYIVNVSSEDGDDGGSANTAVIVPGNS